MEHAEGLVSRHLNRKISRPIARMLAPTSITPNQITLASFAIAVIASVLFGFSQQALGGLLTQLASVVDGVDGDLARLKRMQSDFGAFLDAVLDRYADVAILAGMTLGVLREGAWLSPFLLWLIGLSAISGSLIISYTRARAEASLQRTFRGWTASLASRDLRMLLIMLGGLLGWVLETLILIAFLTHLTAMARLFQARTFSSPGSVD